MVPPTAFPALFSTLAAFTVDDPATMTKKQPLKTNHRGPRIVLPSISTRGSRVLEGHIGCDALALRAFTEAVCVIENYIT